MNGNIDGTIELVVTKIASLQDLLVRLQSFKAELAPMAPTAVPAKPFGDLQRAVIPTKAAMPRVNGKPRPTTGGKGTNKSQQSPGLLLKTCAQLPQPFTAEQVARAIHEKDVGKVSSALSYHVRLSKKLVAVTRGTSHGPGTYRMANVAAGRTAEREQSREHLAVRPQGAAPANGSRTWLLDSALKVSAVLVSVQFETCDVERVLGVDKKRASNWLTQAEMKGWVKRLGVGTYTRTASCPTDSEKTPNAAPLSAADNGDDVEVVPTGEPGDWKNAIAELKHQLAEACKKRDRYRTNGNDTLTNIEQSRIDRLEGQIAALET